jgi:hypothetical protein
VKVSSFLSSGDVIDDCQWEVQALSARFRAGARRKCRVAKEGFQLYCEVNTLMTSSCTLPLECYASTNVHSFEASSAPREPPGQS